MDDGPTKSAAAFKAKRYCPLVHRPSFIDDSLDPRGLFWKSPRFLENSEDDLGQRTILLEGTADRGSTRASVEGFAEPD
jgi:hypothetical protein